MSAAPIAIETLPTQPHPRPPALREVPATREPDLTGGVLSARWVAGWLGLDELRLEEQRARGEAVAFVGADGDALYPVWQFGPDGQVLPAVGRVLRAAARAGIDAHRLHALMGARSGLGRRERLARLLRDGRDDHVVAVIAAAGDQGAR